MAAPAIVGHCADCGRGVSPGEGVVIESHGFRQVRLVKGNSPEPIVRWVTIQLDPTVFCSRCYTREVNPA